MDKNIFDTVYKVNHSGGSGSCFYLRDINLFVTNNHVVDGHHEVALLDNNRTQHYARVVLVNPDVDIALLAADDDFTHLPSLSLAADDSLQISDKVHVAGYPYGMPFTLTEGTVSSPKQLMDGQYFVQTDAAVNPGNSGGPVFNGEGEVVGITVSKFTDADNMGFAIPVNRLREMLVNIGDEIDRETFKVMCRGCDSLISEKENTKYCPNCGSKLPDGIFDEIPLGPLAELCETALRRLGINPVITREGEDEWRFHMEDTEVRIFTLDDPYLALASPVAMLPKNNVEAVLRYVLSTDFGPFKVGVDNDDQILYFCYRVPARNIKDDTFEELCDNIVRFCNEVKTVSSTLINDYGCRHSNYSKLNL